MSDKLPRYRWAIKSDESRIELIDRVSSKTVATIVEAGDGKWNWQRTTSVMFHGVNPAEGSASNVQYAKRKIIEGLPEGCI